MDTNNLPIYISFIVLGICFISTMVSFANITANPAAASKYWYSMFFSGICFISIVIIIVKFVPF